MSAQEPPSDGVRPAPAPGEAAPRMPAPTAQVTALRPPGRWHDPLRLIQNEPPSEIGRIVLWSVAALAGILFVWSAFGQLDIVATAEGRLVPQTLLKIVQPAESGVVKELLVHEGATVKAGQVLARLDTTLASADKAGISSDLATQQMQVRRIEAELGDRSMAPKVGDDIQSYEQVRSQYTAHRQAFIDSLDQEKSILSKVEHERKSAVEILKKLEQTLPTYRKSAAAYSSLEKEGYFSGVAAAEKQREAVEKAKDLDAQQSTVFSFDATIAAQHMKISQIKSSYRSELQKELADLRAKVAQLQPNLDKTLYREGLMELTAPQDGIIKDLATTTVGAVVQPGTVIMTLVPQGEQLFADVNIKNGDVGFVQVNQAVQIKLAAYPFQKYGMLSGTVIHISADASETGNGASLRGVDNNRGGDSAVTGEAMYKARIKLDSQSLNGPRGMSLAIAPGMQIAAEINQGKRSVLEYLLSPVQKALHDAGRER